MSLDKYDTLEKIVALARALEVDEGYICQSLAFCNQRFVDQCNNAETRLWLAGLALEPKKDFILTYEMVLDSTIFGLKLKCQEKIDLRRARRDIAKLVDDDGNAETRKWFVTVNFDDVVVNDSNEAEVIKNFCDRVCSISGLNVISYVPEKFREGGREIHRHIHFIIESDYKKSKVIQYIFQKNIKVGRDKSLAISKKEFIDVKKWESHHDNYVKGIKRDEKQGCVEMDRVWRAEKGIKSNF